MKDTPATTETGKPHVGNPSTWEADVQASVGYTATMSQTIIIK